MRPGFYYQISLCVHVGMCVEFLINFASLSKLYTSFFGLLRFLFSLCLSPNPYLCPSLKLSILLLPFLPFSSMNTGQRKEFT